MRGHCVAKDPSGSGFGEILAVGISLAAASRVACGLCVRIVSMAAATKYPTANFHPRRMIHVNH